MRAQANFLSNGGKNGLPLHIVRDEDMRGFVRFLERHLDCKIDLPALNVAPDGYLTLGPENSTLLKTRAAADFALYASLGKA